MAGAEHEVGVTHCCELALSNWQEKALAPLSHSAVTAAMPCFGPLPQACATPAPRFEHTASLPCKVLNPANEFQCQPAFPSFITTLLLPCTPSSRSLAHSPITSLEPS